MKALILSLGIVLGAILSNQAQESVKELRKNLPEKVYTFEQYQFADKILFKIYQLSDKKEFADYQKQDSSAWQKYTEEVSRLEILFHERSGDVFSAYKKSVASNRYLEFLETCNDEAFEDFSREKALAYKIYKKEKFKAYEKYSEKKMELFRLYKKERSDYYLSYQITEKQDKNN